MRLADGTPFFIGIVFTCIGALLLLRFGGGTIRKISSALARIGMFFVLISATPLPVWAYGIWFLVCIAGLRMGKSTKATRSRRIVAACVLIAANIGFFIVEAPYHRIKRLTVPDGVKVYVIGDSLSAGIGDDYRHWPEVLGGITGLTVVNLAQAGATTHDAIQQAHEITESDCVVIVEIGGNDLLGGTGAAEFRSQLEILISTLRKAQHQIMIIELPLLPFKNGYGAAQRNVAARHGAVLIPKRCLARILGATSGTFDSLHLTQEGHNALAGVISTAIRIRSER